MTDPNCEDFICTEAKNIRKYRNFKKYNLTLSKTREQ